MLTREHSADWEGFAAASALALGLALDPNQLPAVAHNLRTMAEMAALLDQNGMEATLEPAVVFRVGGVCS